VSEQKRKESEWQLEQIEQEKFEIERARATCIPEGKQ